MADREPKVGRKGTRLAVAVVIVLAVISILLAARRKGSMGTSAASPEHS